VAHGAGAALEGLRVIDLSSYLPGPYASMLLADFGADVLHVEPPGGDPARHLPDRMGDDSALHWWVGRNKSSLTLDLKDPGDRARLLDHVARADVVLEGFRPGVAARLGVDYPSCRAVNERIVYCSISSYGQSGRYAAAPGHDLNYSARAGMLSLSADGRGDPVIVGFPLTDVAGGLHAAVGILTALVHRGRTGEGQFVDVSLLDASIGLVGMQLMKALAGRPPRQWEDMNLGGDPAYGLYRTRDGRFVSVACLEGKFWRRLCELLGAEHLVDGRVRDPGGTRAELASIFARCDLAEWDARLEGQDVCYAPVNRIEDVAGDPAVADSGIVTRMRDAGGVERPQLGNPVRLVRTPPALRRPAPGMR
jgi:crotonobetainyl-CoA:carnitine CoA-transferase CaiB-like acyl-CoA transferase